MNDQVLIMQASKYKLKFEITEIKSDMNKIYYDVNKINTMFAQIMNKKHHYLPDKKD